MNSDYSVQYDMGSQAMEGAAAGALFAFAGVMLFVVLIVAIALYVYMAICLMKIAKKTNTENGWFAWIPILNVLLMLQIAKRPVWWLILAIIPFVNLVWIVLGVIVWMDICERLGKDKWLGILSIIPIANIVLPGYLAFSATTTAAPSNPIPSDPTTPA